MITPWWTYPILILGGIALLWGAVSAVRDPARRKATAEIIAIVGGIVSIAVGIVTIMNSE